MAIAYPIVDGVCFKLISDTPGYCVGDNGSIWTQRTNVKGEKNNGWKKMKEIINHKGYARVRIYKNSKSSMISVSRLVLEAFVGPCPTGMEVCHFPDRDKLNNSLANLRWDTHKNNIDDQIVHGTRLKGSTHHQAKITEADVKKIRKMGEAGLTKREISKHFPITEWGVGKILLGKTWKHIKI